MSGVDASSIAAVNNIMGNLSQSITAFTAPIDVDVRIVQVGGFGQQSYQLALTRTLLQVGASSFGCFYLRSSTHVGYLANFCCCQRCIT